MSVPFTKDQFLGVFGSYNTAIWPTQVALIVVALVGVGLCFRHIVPSRSIAVVLGMLWLWTGLVYHILFFSTINPAAVVFGFLCISQGLLFLFLGGVRGRILFGFEQTVRGYTGAAFILYGLLLYPLIGSAIGHGYPYSPTFGAPCPTTIVTFGLLLWTKRRVPWYFYVIPCLWSIIGFGAALNFGIQEDFGLLVAGLLGTTMLALKKPTAVPTWRSQARQRTFPSER
jgi:hypothetical protein